MAPQLGSCGKCWELILGCLDREKDEERTKLCGAQGGDKKGSQRDCRQESKEMRVKIKKLMARAMERRMRSCMRGWKPRREKIICTDWLDTQRH